MTGSEGSEDAPQLEHVSHDELASRTCAVIVTYLPDSQVFSRALEIARQVGAVVVVDNGSGSASHNALEELGHIPTLTLLRNTENVGLGAALNQGVRWAQQQHFHWALLFDQDSMPAASMVTELDQIRRNLGGAAARTLVGCNFVDVNSGRTWLSTAESQESPLTSVMSMTMSGLLLSLPAFAELGPFREDLFVDLIDLEYSLRAKSRGYQLVASTRLLLRHMVGSKTRQRLLWLTVWPSHHSPRRRYLMARNAIRLIREYGHAYPAWAIREMVALLKSIALVLLFEEDKVQKMWQTIRGIVAGLR
jgi:rhamnosyltransferase